MNIEITRLSNIEIAKLSTYENIVMKKRTLT